VGYLITAFTSSFKQANVMFPTTLTIKERQVLSLVAMGLTTKEIADRLNLSHHTIESHRRNMLRKWAVKNSVELVQKANMIS